MLCFILDYILCFISLHSFSCNNQIMSKKISWKINLKEIYFIFCSEDIVYFYKSVRKIRCKHDYILWKIKIIPKWTKINSVLDCFSLDNLLPLKIVLMYNKIIWKCFWSSFSFCFRSWDFGRTWEKVMHAFWVLNQNKT